MPRYLVERTFADGLEMPAGQRGEQALRSIVACNSDRHVWWVCSYVSADRRTAFCLYDAPSPEAIRLTSRANSLPVDRIIEISVLDPYPFVFSPGDEAESESGVDARSPI
jgi:hypothetical protein